ncbi:probable E3 ubiquitin-protein ligase RNF144A-B [Pollicipes pollicipes]|uniref:probable E3 ubiquitin-protein ligase RNF144A-B n=1 Tax=Pollicipes pollicipes TaxID=41117 RepID=UPI001884F12D|nr:probable E3 ubiquitin-protein ligase RNF144A-B [Pollicipes pollicipes]
MWRLPPARLATCRVCLAEVPAAELLRLRACGCRFCRECMATYVAVCVENGEPTVACPEPRCPADGRLSADEVRQLSDGHTYRRYLRLAYIHEVERDPSRTWCPRPGCDTACSLPAGGRPFTCGGCGGSFCAVCRRPRAELDTELHECRPERWLLGGSQQLGAAVKQCPHCAVPIEREDGCAQMMCRRCRHVFCWYCLSSLDGDLFLRHYDRGPCRHLLGHSRGSLVWHRVQLVGALVGVGLVFVVAAPVLILFAPVFMCTSCQCDPAQAAPADPESSSRLAPLEEDTPPD